MKQWAERNKLLLKEPPSKETFLARGGEATIYYNAESRTVLKLNDAIYYATWLEYFNSVVIHNLLFSNTSYTFTGFIQQDAALAAIMEQPFIESDGPVDLEDVKKLLDYNGFKNTKRNDYYNEELGLILEDIHDENVIVKSATLFFIDTVFYTAFQ